MNALTSLDREVLRIMMIDAIGHDPKTWVSSHEYDIGVDGNIDANRLIDVTAKFFEAKARL